MIKKFNHVIIKTKKESLYMRVGMGYDVHKLVEGRDLILGGVKVPL